MSYCVAAQSNENVNGDMNSFFNNMGTGGCLNFEPQYIGSEVTILTNGPLTSLRYTSSGIQAVVYVAFN